MRASFVLLLATALVLATACGDSSSTPSVTPTVPPPAACAADERPGAGGTCELFASPMGCAVGTRPAIGAAACITVGTTSCATGFERDASGWGCAPVLPDAACAGATRPRLGDRVCIPVGDCAAPYPAAGSILVDPALADAAVDATHVKTVAAALAIAADGATIALADGTHTADPFTVSSAISIVGRCAARARLVPSQSTAASGITLGAKVTMRGLTLDGYTVALGLSGALAELIGEDLVIERARSRAVFAQRGAKATLRRSVVRGTVPIGASDQTIAILGGTGAKIVLEDTAILASIDGALAVTDNASTSASLSRCVVQDVKVRQDGKGGGALRAFEGAHLDIAESAILGATGIAILTLRRNAPPPEVTVTRSVIRGTASSVQTGNAIGTAVNAAYEAKVRIDESTISDTEGGALYVAEKATMTFTKSVVVRVKRSKDFTSYGTSSLKGGLLTLEDSAIVGVGGVGVGAWNGGRATLLRSLIRDVGGDIQQNLPLGMGMNATVGSSLVATDSAIVDAREVGVSASGAGSAVHLERFVLTRTDGAPAAQFGHGILSVDAAGFTITRSILERHTGVGLFFAAGGGVIDSSLVRDNAVGAHAQEGSTISEADAAPALVPAQELVVTASTRFVNNATKLGSGVLPLPAPIASP